MKRIDNNEEANIILAKIHLALENKSRAIYNLGYREGYKDATEEVLQSIKEDLLGKFVTEGEEEIDDQA